MSEATDSTRKKPRKKRVVEIWISDKFLRESSEERIDAVLDILNTAKILGQRRDGKTNSIVLDVSGYQFTKSGKYQIAIWQKRGKWLARFCDEHEGKSNKS